jgi:hypothetical protein
VAETSLSNPQQNSVSAVSGSWIVPGVTGPSTGATHSAVWVGIDGYGNSTVEQVGTEQNYINGKPVYDAWWEMYSTGDGQPAQVIHSMTIAPGDMISASVQYLSSGAHAGQFQLSITDWSRANDSFTTYQTSSQTQNPLAQRSSAEWIVEPFTFDGSISALANFNTVFFANATAVINGVYGTINSPSWQSQAINIVSGWITDDTTSALINGGDSFLVTYFSSGGFPVLTGPKVAPGKRSAVSAGVADPSASHVFEQALTELDAFDQATPRRSVAVYSNGRYGTAFSHAHLVGVTATDTDDRVVG